MGYTHYWRKSSGVPQIKWDIALLQCKAILKSDHGVEFHSVGSGALGFNGGVDEDSDDAHEWFTLPATVEEIDGFDFCKTAMKPYDVLVTACLLCASVTGAVEVSSDGDVGEWSAAQDLVRRVLGVTIEIPFSDEEE